MTGYRDQAQVSNRRSYQHHRAVGSRNGQFDFPAEGQHDWGTRGPQLAAMFADLAATLG